MSVDYLDDNVELDVRKEQASQLNIELDDEMTQDEIEEEITIKLETGMKDLKNIIDQMNL